MADPTDSMYVPRPDWYFLFIFQALKLVHGPLESLASVGLPVLAVLALVLVPFIDRSRVRTLRHRLTAQASSRARHHYVGLFDIRLSGRALAEHLGSSRRAPVQYQRVLRLAPDELAGLDYFRRENCQRCHNLLDGEPKKGPNLAALNETRRIARLDGNSLRNPSDETPSSPATGRKLSAAQLSALVSFMSKLTPEKAVNLSEAPASLLTGADIYISNLCASCHKVNGIGGQTGPSLNGVASRRSQQWVAKHFLAPRVMSPGSIMPPYHFPAEEQKALIAYLLLPCHKRRIIGSPA